MHKIGVIFNPNSGGGKNPLHKKLYQSRNAANVIFIETHDRADIAPALNQMALRGVTYLAIIGGDGTVDAVLTTLRKNTPFETEPTIVVFSGGTTNMSFLDIGYKPNALGKIKTPLQDVLDLANSGKIKTLHRAPIEVTSQSLNAPLLGFFFGTNAIPKAIEHTRDMYHKKGLTSTMVQAIATTGMVWQLLRGNVQQDPILTPAHTLIEHDGQTRIAEAVFITLTSLRKLILGIRPLNHGKGTMALMGVSTPYRHFLRYLPSLIGGSKALDPQKDNGCLNLRTDACTLAFDGEWTLDGELFKAYAHMPLHIRTVAPFTFAIGAKTP